MTVLVKVLAPKNAKTLTPKTDNTSNAILLISLSMTTKARIKSRTYCILSSLRIGLQVSFCYQLVDGNYLEDLYFIQSGAGNH
jgi:hypothetical protein